MYENIQENYENDSVTSPDTDSLVSGYVSGSVNTYDSDVFQGTVSGGDNGGSPTAVYYVLDSSGNYIPVTLSGEMVQEELLEASAADAGDSYEVLQGIDYKLSIVIFLMLFFWCAGKIKNAVRSFTGRGIE